MSKLSRYVGNTVGAAILIVLVLIVGLDIVSAIIDETSQLRGDYTFDQAIYYVILTTPGRIFEFMPLSVLIGSLAGMGVLASNSEIVVMRATGVSLLKLVNYALRPAIVMVLLSLLIAEYVSPITDRWATTHKDIKLWGSSHSMVSSRGLWHKEGSTYMHFNVVQPGGVLMGISFFQFDDRNERLVLARSAKRASYQRDQWLLEEVVETRFDSQSTTSEALRVTPWITRLTPVSLAFLASEPEELSPTRLYQYADYLDTNRLDAGPYRLAFWQKILQPAAIISLMLIALSFIFGPLRETTMGFRVFIGVVIGIAFQFAQNLLGPASLIYGFPPIIAVLIPIIVCTVAGMILLARVR